MVILVALPSRKSSRTRNLRVPLSPWRSIKPLCTARSWWCSIDYFSRTSPRMHQKCRLQTFEIIILGPALGLFLWIAKGCKTSAEMNRSADQLLQNYSAQILSCFSHSNIRSPPCSLIMSQNLMLVIFTKYSYVFYSRENGQTINLVQPQEHHFFFANRWSISGVQIRNDEEEWRECVRCICDCVTRAQSFFHYQLMISYFTPRVEALGRYDDNGDSWELSDKILCESSPTSTWSEHADHSITYVLKRNPSNKRSHRTLKRVNYSQ